MTSVRRYPRAVPPEWKPRDDEMPSFTGDVPTDAVLTERLLRHSFLAFLARRFVGMGAAALTAFGAMAVVATVTPWPDWANGEPVSVPTEAVLASVAVVAAAVCLVRRIPGPVRFFVGAVPGACPFVMGSIANGAWGVYPWATPVAVAGVAVQIGYAVFAGIRLRPWAEHRLARLTDGRGTDA